MKELALLNAIDEMVNIGVYKGDNGFKPGYLTHLDEALKISYSASKIKAKPHIEFCIRTLKRDWFIVNDMIHGVKHSSSGFNFNNTLNMVAEDMFGTITLRNGVLKLGGNNESNSENRSDPIASEDVEAIHGTSQSYNDISAAINADKDMRHLVVAAMEEVPKILEVDRTMYNVKIMRRPELMHVFLSCKAPFRLAWLQRILP
ncbi:hypothetical protein Syun_015172 [Stephania yunnanensis]|uniref:Uncharacterized protein n=1 Tax=Stephania yunnanensis TaxID=152371 RepID=A0AAP0JN01_9MAGN